MFTKIITFLIFFAVIGCILYGRKLIKTEKVDAVFGNPEELREEPIGLLLEVVLYC